MTKLKTSLLAAATLAAPLTLTSPAAQAQPVNGLYVGAGAGVNWLQDVTATATDTLGLIGDPGDSVSAKGQFKDPGFVGLVSIGYGFGNGFRAELEGSWRHNRVTGPSISESVNLGECNLTGTLKGVGKLNTLGLMANVLYDFDIGQSAVYPYIGAGAGVAWRKADDVGLRASASCGEDSGVMSLLWDGTGAAFAYQAIAGMAFPIAAVPGLSLTAEYRFFGMLETSHGDATASLTLNDVPVGSETVPGLKGKLDNSYNHSVLLGVRYAFNAAPAAVVAPPVVAPKAKSFLVFFDWDKSTLTDRARGIIKEAAAASKAMKHTVIEVNGYADTSGTPKYNMGLSMRRAQTVAAELVRNGVAKQEIAIKAFGDTVLLVPTGPGVREPQNRRVEIIIK